MDEISGLIIKMTEFFSGDPKRIQHFIKVHTFARVIGRAEGLDIRTMYCLDVASVVHDIGIKPAEESYGKGHCGGKLQEQLGPEPARKMLTELDFDEDIIDRVCFLIAHHHTYEGAQGLDWQILLEADFLVNLYEEGETAQAAEQVKQKIFRTAAGIRFLEELFLADPKFLKN